VARRTRTEPRQLIQALAHANVDQLAEDFALLASHAPTVGASSRTVQDTIGSSATAQTANE